MNVRLGSRLEDRDLEENKIRVLIVGAGKVGFALGQCLNLAGHHVEFQEVNEERCVDVTMKGYTAFNLNSTSREKVIDYDAIFICVPTPTDKEGQNLDAVNSAVDTILKFENIAPNKYLFMKSTVLPNTMRKIINPRVRKAGYICISNPEFLTESDPIGTILNAPFQIFGFKNRKFYCSILGDLFPYPIFKGAKYDNMTWEEAELFKYASNFLLASRISAWNQINLIARKVKADSGFIAAILTKKKEIGEYGKHHGHAYGLSCLPKDVEALNKFAWKKLGVITPMLSATVITNDYMKRKYGTNNSKYVWN